MVRRTEFQKGQHDDIYEISFVRTVKQDKDTRNGNEDKKVTHPFLYTWVHKLKVNFVLRLIWGLNLDGSKIERIWVSKLFVTESQMK